MTHLNYSGWLFDATNSTVDRAITEATEAVADEAHERIQQTFDAVLKSPTGHLAGAVNVEQRSQTQFEVTDGNVIYGPWIEGTGSRNRTTRFKGYRTYRTVAQQLQRDAQRLAERVLRERLR